MLSDRDATRFWSKVRIVDGQDSCWLWTAYTESGYGRFKLDNKHVLAHRLSYQMANGGVIDNTLDVLHTCDTPQCVRPKHLYQGDASQNNQDSISRGRYGHDKFFAAGRSQSHTKKLSVEDAERVVAVYAAEHPTHAELAAMFGVSAGTISNILRGVHWTVRR